jgi:glucoamylase
VKTATGLAVEGADTTSKTEYLHVDAAGRPLSPAYKVTTTDKQGRFEIEKRIFTDPDRNALFVRVTVRALKGPVTPTWCWSRTWPTPAAATRARRPRR